MKWRRKRWEKRGEVGYCLVIFIKFLVQNLSIFTVTKKGNNGWTPPKILAQEITIDFKDGPVPSMKMGIGLAQPMRCIFHLPVYKRRGMCESYNIFIKLCKVFVFMIITFVNIYHLVMKVKNLVCIIHFNQSKMQM